MDWGKMMKTVLFACLAIFYSFTVAAADYYDQFVYRESVNDPGNGYPITTHFFLNSGMLIEIPLDSTQKLLPTAHLFLLENKSYVLVYREAVQDSNKGFISHGCRRIEGRWLVEGNQLHLDDLAVGEPIRIKGKDKVKV